MKLLLLFSLFGFALIPIKQEEAVVLSLAGDIACPQKYEEARRICQGGGVFRAMPADHDAILALGDLLQKSRPDKDIYQENFFRTWPTPANKLYPVPGNHDYRKDRGTNIGYRQFLSSSGIDDRKSWHSWKTSSWLLVGLDSNCEWIDCSADGPQLRWLRRILNQSSQRCILAYFHHPLFHTPGPKQSTTIRRGVRNIWDVLERFEADIVANGHWHHYERFPRLRGNGQPGKVRQFTVGTGGVSLFKTEPHPLSDVYKQEFGFLSLRLRPDSYSWQFITSDKKILDRGEDVCN